jgi:ABC-type uncharacterized transport system substrate-binding protein
MKLFPLVKLVPILCAMILVSQGSASAHPHVWVTMETEVDFGPNKEIIGFKNKWTFDEFYTEFAIAGLDTNGDGVYSEEELKPLAQTNVEALKEFEYFTFPFVDKTKIAMKDPTEYRLVHKDKLLTLYFNLPLATPVPYDKIKEFNFSVYDPGMYVALTFDKKAPIKIASPRPLQCSPHIGDRSPDKDSAMSQLGENIDPASNFGAQFAERVTIDCKS